MASVFDPLKKMNADEFKRVTEVTYLGQVYGTMAALKRMLPRNKEKIIFNRFSTCIQRHSIAICLLRCEAWDTWLF